MMKWSIVRIILKYIEPYGCIVIYPCWTVYETTVYYVVLLGFLYVVGRIYVFLFEVVLSFCGLLAFPRTTRPLSQN
jgi:hypothetical protein